MVGASILIISAASTIGFAWWIPDTWGSLILTWVSAALFIALARRKSSHIPLYLSGCLVQIIGFYWLYGTIEHFGDFPHIAAAALFLLFVLISAGQFTLFGLLYRFLPQSLDHIGIRGACAWVTAELCWIRIFPWQLGHTQVVFTELIQFADILGVFGISFLIMWIVESCFLFHRHKGGIVLSLLTLLGVLWYGHLQMARYSQEALAKNQEAPFQAALIQGNISLEQKHNASLDSHNIAQYKELSLPHDQPNTLIIWPETVIMHWTYSEIKNRAQDPRLPIFSHATLLTGLLMYKDGDTFFNSAIPIQSDGTIGRPYHKQILMPFGEYTPFSSVFPWLNDINNMAGDFQSGTKPNVHTISLAGRDSPIQIATLICYEDVIQSLAADAVQAGAEVFVNMTNDAWFGDSPALYQHHLIASFRAVENKRFHLRATNTGLTAVVSPLGKTTASIPTFSEGALTQQIVPLKTKTLFSRWKNTPWWILSSLTFLLALYGYFRDRKSK